MNGHLKETRKVMSDGKETSLPVMLRGSSWCSHAQLTALNEPILYCSHLHLGSTSKRLIRLHWDKHDLKESLKWCDCDYTTSWADLVTAQMYEEIRLNAELKVSWQSSEHLTRKLETYRDQFSFIIQWSHDSLIVTHLQIWASVSKVNLSSASCHCIDAGPDRWAALFQGMIARNDSDSAWESFDAECICQGLSLRTRHVITWRISKDVALFSANGTLHFDEHLGRDNTTIHHKK